MLLSVGIQSSNLLLTKHTLQNQISPILKTPSFSLISPNKFKLKPVKISASLTLEESTSGDKKNDTNQGRKRRGFGLKPLPKPRLVLKFIWLEKNIGIALDQVIPGGHGTIPLSPYYFWPRKDAWVELKVLLESKPWVSRNQMIVLLNQATDIINLWQQSGGGDLA